MADAMLSGFNGTLANDPFWGMLSYTDRPDTRYAVGNSAEMVAHTEYGRPDPEPRRTGRAHAPAAEVGLRMLGWTADYLEEARLTTWSRTLPWRLRRPRRPGASGC
jgi:hypothetical protein